MIGEAGMQRSEHGVEPAGDGWFVVNATEARWLDDGPLGVYTPFAGDTPFPLIGINLCVLEPGQPNCMYHREDEQEDFFVLSGECLLLVEEQERRLRRWDFVHLPAGTDHVLVGAGDGPCAVLLIGSRTPDAGVVYPVTELAQRHSAGVEAETDSPRHAYAAFDTGRPVAFRPGWLPQQ
jgi:uncharacterized cupin superfamily protein